MKKMKTKQLHTVILALFFALLPATAMAGANISDQKAAEKDSISSKENIELSIPEKTAAEKKTKEEPITAEFRWIMPKLHLTVNTGKITPGERDTINFRDRLGIDNANAPEIKISSGKFDFDYIRVRQSGNVHVTDSLTYQGETFTNVNVHSKLELDYIAVNWKQKIMENERVELYGGTGIRIYHMYTSVTGTADPGVNRTGDNELFRVAPVLNISAKVHLDAQKKLDFFSDFSGLAMGCYGYLYDYEAGLRYKPQDQFSVSAGYRVISMNADLSIDNDDRPMYRLRGPYFSMLYQF